MFELIIRGGGDDNGVVDGVDATCEVCPHHLVLDEDDADAIGALATRGAPPRSADEIETLRQAPAAGEILWIGPDRSPAPADMTEGEDMFAVSGGIAGARAPLAASLTHGLRRGEADVAVAR